MENDENIIKIDFSKPQPDEAFRSIMVDVFKTYFATSTVDGLPTAVSLDCILSALKEATAEMDPGAWGYWRETIISYVEERFGVRVMEPEDFEELRRKVEQFEA